MIVPAFLLRLMTVLPFRGRIKGEEDATSIAFASALRAWTLEGRLTATFSKLPHEVGAVKKGTPTFKAAQARYALARAMGLITGSGDYVFVWSEGGGWLEMKAAKGSLSPAQRDFRDWAAMRGVRYAVARSVDEAEQVLTDWGILK